MKDNEDIDEFDSFMDGGDSLSDLQKAVDSVIGKKELDTLKGELSHDQPEMAYQDINAMIKRLYLISLAVQIKKFNLELKDSSLEKIIELINISVDPSHSSNTADIWKVIGKSLGVDSSRCDLDFAIDVPMRCNLKQLLDMLNGEGAPMNFDGQFGGTDEEGSESEDDHDSGEGDDSSDTDI